VMRRSVGWSGLGTSWNEFGVNFVPHQGHSSSGKRRRLLAVVLVRDGSRSCGVGIAVTLAAHLVGRGRATDPQADLEGPVAQLVGVLLTLQLEGADQRRGAAELSSVSRRRV